MARRTASFLLALLPLAAIAGCGRAGGEAAEDRPPVVARVEVDRATATLGDVITYRLQIDHDGGLEVRVEEPGQSLGGLPVIDAGAEPSRASGQRQRHERWWRLRAEELGSYVLPPLVILSRPAGAGPGTADPGTADAGRWQTAELFVEVVSVLPADGEVADIRDIKPPQEPPLRFARWLLILFGGVPALALLAALLRARLRRQQGPARPRVPAHETALAALRELGLPAADDPQAVRRFAFRVSELVRAYVEARFGLNATDLTTEEILPELGRLAELETRAGAELAGLLRAADRVKFAAHRPRSEEIAAMAAGARAFVEATRPIAAAGGEEKAA